MFHKLFGQKVFVIYAFADMSHFISKNMTYKDLKCEGKITDENEEYLILDDKIYINKKYILKVEVV